MSVETKERYIWFWVAIKLDSMVTDVEFIQVILLFNSTDQRVLQEPQDVLRSQLHSVVKLVWGMLAARALSWKHTARVSTSPTHSLCTSY